MEDRETKHQTVFLIDLETLNLTDAEKRKQVYQSIILSAFRILYFFQCQSHTFNTEDTGKKGETLKWSFKFFNSSTYKVFRNQSTLREFRMKYFSEFENECEKILSKQKTKSQSPNKENPQNKNSKTSSPAENLSKALKDVIYDFQWESSEFFSPMKGRRNHTKQAAPTSSNSVFLFSKIPKDAQDLRSFCGKKVIDDEVFMDSFMSSSLFDMFHILSKLSLFWIDTELHQAFKDNNTQDIVSKSLKKVGGCFISLNSLVKIPLSTFKSCLQKPLSVSEKQSLELEELKSNTNVGCIFNDFINNLPIQTVLHHKIDTSSDDDCEVEACFNLVDGDTCSAVPVLLSTCLKENQPHNLVEASDSTEHQSISFTLLSDIHNTNKKPTGDDVTINISSKKNNDTKDEIPTQFIVIGCITHTNTNYQYLPIAHTYLCHNVKDYSAAGTLPHILPDMLTDLMRDNKKMVVLSTGVLPYLGILQPVNENGGMLTLYHIGSTLQIEKAMFKQEYKEIEEDNSKTDPIPCKLSSTQLSCLGQQFHLHSKGKSNQKQKGVSKRKVKKFKPQVLDKWHLPGTSHGMESIVMKLNERLNDLEFLDPKEKNTLKTLQKFYRKQNQPPKLADLNPTAQFQHIDENAMSSEDMKMNNTTSEGGYSLRRQSSSLSRTDIIMNRSKHVQKRQSSETADIGVKTIDDTKSVVDMSNIDLQTDEDVCDYIKDLYEKCLDTINSNNLETTIHTLVTVVLHHMKTNNRSEPEESCKSLINKTIKQSNIQLREKYQTKTTDLDKKDKMTEYKLQILLLLELESVIMSEDDEYIEQCAEEVVNMLRTVSFIYDQSVVPIFLNEVIVTNYSATLPKLLISIFDELMQPLPSELAGFASPSADTSLNSVNSHHDSSVFQEPSSITSNHSDILLTQPSRRSRRVVHHPSLSNIGSKKQIMVALDNKPKVAKEKKEKRRTVVSKPSKSKPKQEEAVKVRRNLFEGEKPKIDRRQSVAIMESFRRSPRKHKISSTFKNTSGSPLRRLVAETPSHKQKSSVVWRQQDRKRRRTNSKDDVNVVEESPIKACEDNRESETEVKASPGRFRKKAAVTRRSFYSASATRTRPRNLSAYYNLGDRIAGRNRGLSQTEDKLSQSLNHLAKTSPCKKFMSPTRRSRTFFMSQLMSPSPNKNMSSRLAESPSHRTRSKTPRKTPSRILFESPRRRVNSPSKLLGVRVPESPHGKTPKKQTYHPLRSTTTPKSKSLVCDTPEKTTPRKVLNTPLKHTPKRSPRLGNKENHENIHHTPKSSRKIPSTPDRSKESPDDKVIDHTLKLNSIVLHETPTKTPKSKSVKKSLMKDSPCRNTRSQGPITPTRNSVCTALFTTSPLKTYVLPQAHRQKEESAVFKTPSKMFKLKSPPSTHKQKLFSPFKSILERNSKVENISPDKPTYIIRTPSPHDKNIKTPDSLDKWPRVKRHRESPARKLESTKVKIHKPSLSDVIDDNSVCDPILESKCKKKRQLSDCDNSETLSSSPKRQRMDNESHTQTDGSSSKGYFSNINHSVFLPIKQPDSSGEGSPVFGSSPLRIKMKPGTSGPGITELLSNSSQESTLSDIPVPFQSIHDSPVFKGKSPVSKIQFGVDTTKGKKFSPSLSSNSLVQLMNSPLLQSGTKEYVTSPSRKTAFKSRKSLKLGD